MARNEQFDSEIKRMDQIVADIENFVGLNKGMFPQYYIGITDDSNSEITENETLSGHLNRGLLTEQNPVYFVNAKTWENALKITLYFQAGGHGMQEYKPGVQLMENHQYLYCFKTVNNG